MLLDFFSLDRAVQAAARGLDELERHDGPLPGSPPIPRAVSTRTLLIELEAFGAEPLAVALRPWVARLTLERATWRERVALSSALGAPRREGDASSQGRDARGEAPHATEATHATEPAARDALVALLRERVPERRAGRLGALVAAAPGPHEAWARWAARRAEAEHELYAKSARPAEPASLARAVLDATSDRLPRQTGLADVLDALLAREASRGWPRRAGARFVGHALRETSLLSGVRLERAEREPLGAATFARELERAGRRFFDVVAQSPARPFSVARPADERARESMAALFASMTLVPGFQTRVLELGRREALGQLGALGRATLLHLRTLAFRAWLARAAREGRVPTELAEESARVFGEPLAPRLVGVVPRLDREPEARLEGALVALAAHAGLRERFDEDWYRNPRAAEALREEADPLGVASASAAAERETLARRALAELTI